MIERITGEPQVMCPWRGFYDPVVHDVRALYRAAWNGHDAHLASIYSDRLPHYLWDGVQHYADCVSRIKYQDAERERKEAKKKNRILGGGRA